MLQIIDEITRKVNTLDRMFTNEISIITGIEINNSNHSDNNKVEGSTNYTKTEFENSTLFKTLNFCAKSVNWNNIKYYY